MSNYRRCEYCGYPMEIWFTLEEAVTREAICDSCGKVYQLCEMEAQDSLKDFAREVDSRIRDLEAEVETLQENVRYLEGCNER